jgi:tetratricopeptide (TPR) repeat protein
MEDLMERRRLLSVGLVVVLGLVGACSKPAPEEARLPPEEAWTELKDALGETESSAEKAALVETFLRGYPEGENAGKIAGAWAYYRGEALDDPAGALTLLEEILPKNTDPEVRFNIATAMFPLSAELGRPVDLAPFAEELTAVRPLTFSERIDIADTAIAHGQWQVAASFAESALETATPEAFLADYPDDGFTAEQAAEKAGRRTAMAQADLGWALWNLGDKERAAAAFEVATAHRTESYLGIADTPVDLYRGKALLADGDAEAAIELLAPIAVMSSDDDAMTALRQAFAAVNPERAAFDEFLWSQRQRLAKPIDGFTLADYEGTPHDFSALSAGKVTLLAFWFPT